MTLLTVSLCAANARIVFHDVITSLAAPECVSEVLEVVHRDPEPGGFGAPLAIHLQDLQVGQCAEVVADGSRALRPPRT